MAIYTVVEYPNFSTSCSDNASKATTKTVPKTVRNGLNMIEMGDASAVLSIVSVAEVMQGPIKKGHHQNAQEVKNYLLNFPNISCQEITTDVLEHIGRNTLICWSKLRTIDSLIIASGLSNGVELFISNDTHFKKAIPQNLALSFNT